MALKPNSIVIYQGHKCSYIYAKLLTVAREDIKFELDSGYRSVAEQWVLWRKYKAGKGPLAAFPGTSTHNKRGWKQGLDINSTDGGTSRFRNWCKAHGMEFDLTVHGEAWHVNAKRDYNDHINTLYHAYLARKKREQPRKRRPSHG